ncbi:MAG TPA: autotransporter domain-containing protein [Usitatibacter sp.]|jgi:outer membrane lipase/esterase|nr:autotransporter domain-containing protein [Usitatibacter sp.]
MKTKRRVLPALVFTLFAATAAGSASAQQFSSTIVFGDSLSDDGYFRPVLSALGLPAPLVSQLGRFTTSPGPVWSELVTEYYGGTPAASNAGGNIYAQGGARVTADSSSTPAGAAQRSVSTQITEYLSKTGGTADPHALYAIWAGANDVIQTLQAAGAGQIPASQLPTIITDTANAEIGQIARLQAAGAKYIIVVGLPNIGATPGFQALGPATAGGATQLSAGFNTALFTGLAASGIHVIPVDANAFLAEVFANPSRYGFSNVTVPACKAFPPFSTGPDAFFCPPGNTLTPDASQTFLFADGIHPTTAAHAEIAQFIEGMITGPAEYSLLAEVPLRTRAGHMRTVWEGLAGTANDSIGRMSIWATADRGNFDVDTSMGVVGLDSTNKSGTIGLSARVSEGVAIGVAVGKTQSDATLGGSNGAFRTNETVFSAFAQGRWGGLYADGIVSIADINFSNTSRNIPIGPTVRVATSSPSGSNASAYFDLGYDFKFKRVSVGPLVSVTSQNVDINAFDESGADSSDLHIFSQSRRSEVWSVGVKASLDMGAWSPWVRITSDKERKDDGRFVTAMPLSLASNNSYDIPAYNFDTSFITGAVGVRGRIDRIGLSIAYYKVSGRSGLKEDGVTGMLSYRF